MKSLLFIVLPYLITGVLGIYLDTRHDVQFRGIYWLLGAVSSLPLVVLASSMGAFK